MTRDENRMTAAELRVVMHGLGLGVPALARVLDVRERTVRYWLAGTYTIPDGVREHIGRIEGATADAVASLVDALNDEENPTLTAYRDDAALWAAHPEARPLPAAWWNMVAYRAASEARGAAITYGSAP